MSVLLLLSRDIKVVWVVVFCSLILSVDNTNSVMQNIIQKFGQRSIVFEKPGFLSGKLKTDELQLP